jgi:anthranilate synthase/aminodeoxychorismate synthase-like glutamine amidotransferase
MLLMIDNYDSFTYNLVRYFNELGSEVVVMKNDEFAAHELPLNLYEGIVLSPGPGAPDATPNLIQVIDRFKDQLPILGICLGHQAIAHAFGGKITKSVRPLHGKVTPVIHDGQGLFLGIKKNPLLVTEYHSLTVQAETLPPQLMVTCWDKDKAIMGLRHRLLPIEGVQFHPEAALTECGHDLLANFLKTCQKKAAAS